MRVVQVTTVHPGTENRITKKHAVALRDAGHEVHLVAPEPRISEPGIEHHVLPEATGRVRRVLLRQRVALAELHRIRPDVVHAHDPELIPSVLAYCRAHRAKFVYDAHENLVAQISSKPYLHPAVRPLARGAARLLETTADRAADAVVVAEDELRPLFPRNDKVISVRNYPWAQALAGPARSAHDRPVLGYVGSITQDRGLQMMIECARLSRHQPLLRLAGRMHPPSLADTLPDGVEYVGPISPESVPAFLHELDLGLCLLKPRPNYINARSTKIYEYMMASLPFVFSHFPAWVAEHGHDYGVPVDPEDARAAVSEIDDLLDDPEELHRRGRLGRSTVLERFTYDADASRLTRLYKELEAG